MSAGFLHLAADNGPGTPSDEGLSYVVFAEGHDLNRVPLAGNGWHCKDAHYWAAAHGCPTAWPILFLTISDRSAAHASDGCGRQIGWAAAKPEAYYFPTQLNNHPGRFPHTFFGLEPGTTREQVRQCLDAWNSGDNKILNLSKAYALEPGTGWDVPAGVLHAPGSLLTYEPQADSDVFAMFQSLVDLTPIDRSLLVKNVPPDRQDDLDYMVDMLDWELNVDRVSRTPLCGPCRFGMNREMRDRGYEIFGSPIEARLFQQSRRRSSLDGKLPL